MRLQDLASGRSDLYRMDPAKIKVKSGWNVREKDALYYEELEELIASVTESGVLQPLTVYADGEDAFLEDGHRRYDAVMIARERGAEILTVPVQPGGKNKNEVDRALSMWTRNSGRPLRQIEAAALFKRLVGWGLSQQEIAKRTGLSESAVSQILAINGLPIAVQAHIQAGEIAPSVAVAIQRSEGAAAPAAIAAAVTVARAAGKTKVSASDVRKAAVVDEAKDRQRRYDKAIDAINAIDEDDLPKLLLWLKQRV